MAFSHSRNVKVYGGQFTDVQGDLSYNFDIAGDLSLNDSDARIHAMCNAVSSGAAYDSAERSPPARCHPGTRLDLLKQIMSDIEKAADEKAARTVWFHGPAGAGKTAIAQTTAETCASRGYLAASFFFSRGRPGRDSIPHLFPTLAYQLAISIPALRPFVLEAFANDPSIISKSTDKQIQKLLIEPFRDLGLKAMDGRCTITSDAPYLVVIDGLDECSGNDNQSEILRHVVDLVDVHSLPLRFLIASRPEPHIKDFFEETKRSKLFSLISLYGDHQSHEDVRTYLLSEFKRIRSSARHKATFTTMNQTWPFHQDVDLVVYRSSGYFIYASTLVRYVDEEYFSPVERLQAALNTSTSGSGAFRELDKLYQQVLSINPNVELLKHVLGFILGPRDEDWGIPIPGWFITHALHLQPDQLSITLRGLHSILTEDVSKEPGGYLFLHASFHDFIFDPSRAGKFYIDPRSNHLMITRAYMDSLTAWFESRTANFFVTQILRDFLFQFYKAGAHLDTIKEDLLATDVSFWYFFYTPREDPKMYWKLMPSRVSKLINWWTKAIHIFQVLEPVPLDLIQHFRALRQITLRGAVAWSSVCDTQFLSSNKISYEEVLQYLETTPWRVPEWMHHLPSKYPDHFVGFRDHVLKSGQVRNSDCDIRDIHSNIVENALHVLLKVSKADLARVDSWANHYTYARTFWAGHISRANPDTMKTLLQLEKIPRLALFDINKAHTVISLPEEGKKQWWLSPANFINRRLDKFDSHGWHQETINLKIPNFSRIDWTNAKIIIRWLKSMKDAPGDLLLQWEETCKECQSILVLEQDELSKLEAEFDQAFITGPPLIQRVRGYVARVFQAG